MKVKYDKLLDRIRESDEINNPITGLPGTLNSVPVYNGSTLVETSVFIDSGDIIIPGRILNPSGNITEIETTNLIIEDPLIKLAKDNISDVLDIGFYGKYNNAYTGLYRDSNTGSYKLFEGLINEPTTTVDSSNASYSLASLEVLKINNVAITSIGSANQFLNGQGNYTILNTSFIQENTNLYYTEDRVNNNITVLANTVHRNNSNNPHNTNISNLGSSTLNDLNTLLGTTLLNQSVIATITDNGFMSNIDKIKLNNIEDNAQVNVQSDWLANNGDALILNKPITINTQQSNDIILNSAHRVSNGTDHSFIDQDITTTSSPTFQGLTISNTTGNIKAINGIYIAKEEFYIEKLTIVNNTTTTNKEYFSDANNPINNVITVQGGLYDITINMLTRNTSASGSIRIRPQINGNNIFTQAYRHRPGQGADRQYVSITKRVNMIAGNNTIQLQLSNVGAGTARIYEANIIIKQV